MFISTAQAATITEQSASTASQTTSGLSSFFNTIWAGAPGWIAAMIVFACSLVVARIVKEKVLDKVSSRFSEDDKDILTLIGRTTYVAVLGVGITIALSIAGIDLTAIIAAVGFGLGFAMQDLVMNFMAGILILMNRPFSIGDFIQVNSTVGKVEEIQSRATILKALDGTRVIVPNADLFKNQVTSFTTNPFRRVDIPVGVEYRTDLAHASRVILEAITSHPKVLLDPPPNILLDSFGESSINFNVRFWVESRSNWLKTKSEVIHLIKQHLDRAGISIPFPMRTLVFDKDTEGVVMPTHPLSESQMETHKKRREMEQAQLAEAIASSEDRVSKMVFSANVVLPSGHTKPVEETVETGPAIALEPANPPVTNTTPGPIPVADQDIGANFLKASS